MCCMCLNAYIRVYEYQRCISLSIAAMSSSANVSVLAESATNKQFITPGRHAGNKQQVTTTQASCMKLH